MSVSAGIPDFRSPEVGLYAQIAKLDIEVESPMVGWGTACSVLLTLHSHLLLWCQYYVYCAISWWSLKIIFTIILIKCNIHPNLMIQHPGQNQMHLHISTSLISNYHLCRMFLILRLWRKHQSFSSVSETVCVCFCLVSLIIFILLSDYCHLYFLKTDF